MLIYAIARRRSFRRAAIDIGVVSHNVGTAVAIASAVRRQAAH